MGDPLLRVTFSRIDKAIGRLRAMPAAVDAAVGEGTTRAAVYLQGRVKEHLSESGPSNYPHWRTGRLYRAVTAVPAVRAGQGWRAQVGVTATVPYGAILEYGGSIPEVEIWAGAFTGRSSKKALAWPSSYQARARFGSELGRRATPKQAQARTRKAFRGGFAFATHVTIPARYQRPIPYLNPTYQEELPAMQAIIRDRVGAAVRAATR